MKLADLARKRLREKIPQLRLALAGRVTDHHRFLLGMHLDHPAHLEELIARPGARVEEVLAPFAEAAQRLTTIPGVSQRVAEVVVAEIGPDMKQFPTAAQLASWAGLCPGNHESAGKRKGGRTAKGDRWLRAALVQGRGRPAGRRGRTWRRSTSTWRGGGAAGGRWWRWRTRCWGSSTGC